MATSLETKVVKFLSTSSDVANMDSNTAGYNVGALIYSSNDKSLYIIDSALESPKPISKIIPVTALPEIDNAYADILYKKDNVYYYKHYTATDTNAYSWGSLINSNEINGIIQNYLNSNHYLTKNSLENDYKYITSEALTDYINTQKLEEILSGKKYATKDDVKDFIKSDYLTTNEYITKTALANYDYITLNDVEELEYITAENSAITNKLNAVNGTSTNLTESTSLTIGSSTSQNKITLTSTGITKTIPEGDNTVTKKVLFENDLEISKSNNTYTFKYLGTSHTINIPVDLVVRSGEVIKITTETEAAESGFAIDTTCLVLTLNATDTATKKNKIYINVADLANAYTVPSNQTGPAIVDINDTNEISVSIEENSITGTHLSDSLELNTVTLTNLKGAGENSLLTINEDYTINNTGLYSGTANTANHLTTGKSLTVESDDMNTVGITDLASTDTNTLTINLKEVNTDNFPSEQSEKTVEGSVDSNATSSNYVIKVPKFTVNKKGLVVGDGVTDIAIGALNKVALASTQEANNSTAHKIILKNGASAADHTLEYSNLTYTPSTGAINAKAPYLTAGKTVKVEGDMSATTSDFVSTDETILTITLNTVNESNFTEGQSTKTIEGSVANTSTSGYAINVPKFTVNKKGLVVEDGTSEIAIGALNKVALTNINVENNKNAYHLILKTGATAADQTLEYTDNLKYDFETDTIDANAATASAFSTMATMAITGGATGSVESKHGWSTGITLNANLAVGTTNSAVEHETTANDTTHLNLYAPDKDNEKTVLGSVQLKGSNGIDVSSNDGVITFSGEDLADTFDNYLPLTGGQMTGNITYDTSKEYEAGTLNQSNIISIGKDGFSFDMWDKQSEENRVLYTLNNNCFSLKENTGEQTFKYTKVQPGHIHVTASNNKENFAPKEWYAEIYPTAFTLQKFGSDLPNIVLGIPDTSNSRYVGAYTETADRLQVNGSIRGTKVYGAVWNDYAEYRQTHHKVKPGQCVYEKGDGSLAISYERMMPGANIVSDTFGFAIGETDECKTPLAVSGRVLAYPYESKETYNPGDAVCSGPNGTISKMTRAEIRDYPERIVGTVSEIPTYEVWGSGNIKVNGRIWIKVK